MATVHTFSPDNRFSEIVLVGLGGTGSQWARTLCRIIYDLRRRRQHVPQIRFIDPDRIEEKNVGRQMFSPSDIGTFKAETLARRFNLALGLGIIWHNEPFDATKHARSYGTLLCGAVDNHAARIELSKAQNAVWVEAGNHATAGSVIIGNSNDKKAVVREIKAGRFHYLPTATALFPSLLEPEPTSEPQPTSNLSCADLIEQGTQHLLINDLMGSIAGEYTFKLLNRVPVQSFMTFVDTDSLSMRSIPITRDDLLAYLG
jgi:PRTRC genetic system ThiF family protein